MEHAQRRASGRGPLGEHVHQRPRRGQWAQEHEDAPADLLAWFAPRANAQLHVVDRFTTDPRTEACPTQLCYVREGGAQPGQQLSFTQVLLPHLPHRVRATTNNPNPGAEGAYRSDLEAAAGASGIRVIRDDVDVTVLRLDVEPGQVEWIALNPRRTSTDFASGVTDAPYAYVTATRPD